MRNITWLAIVSAGICAGSAHAQGYPGGVYNPGSRPAFSPYLNLQRPDSPLVTNYYGLVRPQLDFQNSLQQLDAQQALGANQQQSAVTQESRFLPPTGHVARFMTQSRYFLTNSAGGVGGGGYGGGGYGGGGFATAGLGAGGPGGTPAGVPAGAGAMGGR